MALNSHSVSGHPGATCRPQSSVQNSRPSAATERPRPRRQRNVVLSRSLSKLNSGVYRLSSWKYHNQLTPASVNIEKGASRGIL